MMMNFSQMDTQKCLEYIQALEDERRKIQVFQRELPLCFELVTQALETYKQQLSRISTTTEHSECSDQTTNDGPILEEFIPLKRSSSTDDDDDENEHEDLDKDHHITENQNNDTQHDDENAINSDKSGKKSDWLRSVQLWNQTPDPASNQEVHEHQPKRVPVVEVNKNGGGAFHPFQKEIKSNGITNNKPVSAPTASACSSAEAAASGGSGGNNNGKKDEKGGQSQRKQRRCWSPELHRRFLHALQQLGGSHAATPKQIRELMKVDGLTNDEVKSHLQKYRLHTRRPTPTIHSSANQQAPQFVVVGGIWVPPPEYAAVAAKTNTTGDTSIVASTPNSAIYAPVAAVAPPPAPLQSSTVVAQRLANKEQSSQQYSHCEERGSPSEHSNSPATSSSTHTTASHAY